MAVVVWIKDAHSVKLESPQGYGSKPLVTALNVLWKEMHTCSDLGERGTLQTTTKTRTWVQTAPVNARHTSLCKNCVSEM